MLTGQHPELICRNANRVRANRFLCHVPWLAWCKRAGQSQENHYGQRNSDPVHWWGSLPCELMGPAMSILLPAPLTTNSLTTAPQILENFLHGTVPYVHFCLFVCWQGLQLGKMLSVSTYHSLSFLCLLIPGGPEFIRRQTPSIITCLMFLEN